MKQIIFPTGLKLGNTADLPASGKSVGELQSALLRLNLDISPSDLARKEMGASTAEALRAFQAQAGLPADGRLTEDTAARINAALEHSFVTRDKTRTRRLQDLLTQAGQRIDPVEISGREFGTATERGKDFSPYDVPGSTILPI